jgi:hypothetical protein
MAGIRPVSWPFASLLSVLAWACLLASVMPGALAEETGVLRSLDGQSPAEQPLPADIRRGLNMDERSLSCFTNAQGKVRFEEAWFAAMRIDLDGDGRPDWIVHSVHPCLGGDGGVRWWVFRDFKGGRQLILAANAARLDILREKVGGFHVIDAGRARYHYSIERTEYVAEGDGQTIAENGVVGDIGGVWRPESKALEGLGPLTIASASLEWSICRNARVDKTAPDEAGKSVVLNIGGNPGCHLDGRPVRHLRIKAREDGCKAELWLYASPEAMANDDPLAWGVIGRARCSQ